MTSQKKLTKVSIHFVEHDFEKYRIKLMNFLMIDTIIKKPV